MNRGVTFIELMVVIAILAVLMAFISPIYSRWAAERRLERDLGRIYSALLEARELAFSEKRVCGLVWEAEPFKSLSLRCDTDSDGSIVDPEGFEIVKQVELTTSFRSNFGSRSVTFLPTGFPGANKGSFFPKERIEGPVFDCVKVSFAKVSLGHVEDEECK